MQTWYHLKADADKPPVLSIFDDIGAYGVSAKNFLNDLRAVASDTVDVEINSPGGDVFAGLAIYNGLRASGKTINVKVLGLAASAASLIAMAGDSIEMPENSFMMVHNPWGFAMGGADEMRSTADVLDKIGASLVATYAKRTGKSDEEITALLAAETWMTAQEAVDAGFATTVTPALAVRASYSEERLPEAVRLAFKAQAPEAPATAAPAAEQPPEDAAPQATEAPAAPEAPEFGQTLADQVQAVAAAAGLSAYAALWAADPALGSKDAITARAELAREVQALCALAKMPEKADHYIKAATPLQSVRDEIFAALDRGYEHVDTAPPAKQPQNLGAQPAAVKGADIWAARRQKTRQ